MDLVFDMANKGATDTYTAGTSYQGRSRVRVYFAITYNPSETISFFLPLQSTSTKGLPEGRPE